MAQALKAIADRVQEGLILSNDEFRKGFMKEKVNSTLPSSRQMLSLPPDPPFQEYSLALNGFVKCVKQEVLFGKYEDWDLTGLNTLVDIVGPLPEN